MSRWIDHFKNHEFQKYWTEIVEDVKNLTADNASVETDLQEISRLKKAVIFLQGILNGCDPELIPVSTWDQFKDQSLQCTQQLAEYKKTRQNANLIAINKHIDNLLSYLKPYEIQAGERAKLAQQAFFKYSQEIAAGLDRFKEKVDSKSDEIDTLKESVVKSKKQIDSISKEIDRLSIEYFEDTEDKESAETKISRLFTSISTKHEEIENFYDELMGSESSIKSLVISASTEINQRKSEIDSLLKEVNTDVKDIKSFYDDSFGSEGYDAKEWKHSSSIRDRLDKLIEELEEFNKEQHERYSALNGQIESLLPGATSAGLATSYHTLKKSFKRPITIFTTMFCVSIFALSFVALATMTTELSLSQVTFIELSDYQKAFGNLIMKLPLLLPLIWLAYFFSKRRSEAQRLQQEYAHKEAIAVSYVSFKNQITALKEDHTELMNLLLASAISAISHNASTTLGDKHGDKSPPHAIFEQLMKVISRK